MTEAERWSQRRASKLPDFETRGVLDKGLAQDSLTYGILFKTHRERTEFIELARKGAGHDKDLLV